MASVDVSTLTPSIPYDDLPAAISWLSDVLGLATAAKYKGPDGRTLFAQLVWRNAAVFVHARPSGDNPWAVVGPASIALAAEDASVVEAAYHRAVATGSDIVRPYPIARTPMFLDGSHQFDVRDPGGNLWTVSSFQPRLNPAKGLRP